MTTWQEEQPMSRRALRESERAHAQATMSDTGEVEAPKTDLDQQIWADNSMAEPLHYSTQIQQSPPSLDEPFRRPRQSGGARPSTDSGSYRLRDFSPENRGSSFSSTQSAPWTPPAAGSEDLRYHTSVGADRPGPAAYSAPTPTPPVVVTPEDVSPRETDSSSATVDAPMEHTLTRRQIRELREAAQPRMVEVSPLVEPNLESPNLETSDSTRESVRDSAQSAELAAAMAEFDKLYQARQEIPDLIEPPVRGRSVLELPPFESVVALDEPAVEPAVEPVVEPAVVPEPPIAEARVIVPEPLVDEIVIAPAPIPEEIVVAPEPIVAEAPVLSPSLSLPTADRADSEPLREIITAPEVYSAPEGHWSNQPTIDEVVGTATGPHTRNLAASDAITTSALVLPSFPSTSPLTGPVSGTGEILITGTIDLPRSLGVNGLHPSRYDRADLDSIIDAGDREDSAPDSAPVRAVRAVSTYTSSQGIINTKRPKGNNLPMILSITAGVMMVGVVVLVVAGMIFKIF